MKRNDSFRTDKLSLFLFGMGAGLLSMVPASQAQTQLSPLTESGPAIRSPSELMTGTTWNQPSTVDTDDLAVRSPAALNRVIVNPKLAKAREAQKNGADSIQVDSTVFDLDSKKITDNFQAKASSVDQPKSQPLQPLFEPLRPLKFPVNWKLPPIKQPNEVSVAKPKLPRIVSPAEVATAGLTETSGNPINAKQIAATSENPETIVPKASLAFLRKPIDITDPTTLAKSAPVSQPIQSTPKVLLQPISTSAAVVESAKEEIVKPTRLTNAPTYDFQTPLPTGPISLFVDGPDYLSVKQVGEYEIAIANSSSDTTSVSNISLQVPRGVEIIAVQREAEINDQDRTLNWSIDKIRSGKQQRIRFRVKSASACKVDFSVTVSQDGRESQTVSQTTIIR